MTLVKENLNYESEVEDLILEVLQDKYLIKDNYILFRYLLLKFNLLIYDYKNKIDENKEFEKFLLRELNLNKFIYKGMEFKYYGMENSFSNIYDNLLFKYKTSFIEDGNGIRTPYDIYLKRTISEIIKESKKKSKNLKDNKCYNFIYDYFKIKTLNNSYNLGFNFEVKRIVDVDYSEEYMSDLPLEDELERYYRAAIFKTDNLDNISESDLEDYLYKDLNKIEKGLIGISRQYKVQDGIIDILAKDKDENLVIIELKIANDKNLIWQSVYYPLILRTQYKDKKIRVITICPEYPDYIKIPLIKVSNAEMFKYRLNIENNKIKSINLNKLKDIQE